MHLTQAEKDYLIVSDGVEVITYRLPLERLLDRIKDMGHTPSSGTSR